ncbi:TonB-dependent receptor plug domain-containing protein [Neolewinella antarctica]|uniref:TonB-dependent receptor plug domain-containing protein n=1 Tax=Neolewinella antarctica TaxID=442734 RepID=A0ABX0X9C6_9BACT|nr:TonB-dependent receptor plug domain-containing protein [Neolewinella antarctica]NJC25869.1 hypothetical protein [Neolewinella antarctica]
MIKRYDIIVIQQLSSISWPGRSWSAYLFQFFLAVVFACPLRSQDSLELTVVVNDYVTGLPISEVYFLGNHSSQIKGVSNQQGVAVLLGAIGDEFITSHIGYFPDTVLMSENPATANITLLPKNENITLISVTSQRRDPFSAANELSKTEINAVPRLLGEADPLRAALRIAGVESGGEASSRLHVRGGLPGENLTLLDGVPVYNETHVGPLFSVFNAAVLESFTVYKTAAPVEKGSGISALLDATTRKPNLFAKATEFNVGPINSGFYLNRPLGAKDKTALQVALRGSPLSILSPFVDRQSVSNATLIELGDINVAYRYKSSTKNDLLLRAFYTHDEAFFATTTTTARNNEFVTVRESDATKWSNLGTSITYEIKERGRKTYLQAYFASYNYSIKNTEQYPTDQASFTFQGNLQDVGLRANQSYQNKVINLIGGINAKIQLFNPIELLEAENIVPELFSETSAQRIDAFFSADYSMGSRTRLKASGKVHGYRVNNYSTIIPTGYLQLSHQASEALLLRFSLERVAQFEHALPAFGGAWQLNTWLPSSQQAPAQIADRVEVGWQSQISPRWTVLQALYYRKANQLFRTATEDLTAVLREDNQSTSPVCCLTGGEGENYGVETSLEYEHSATNVGLNYTLAKSSVRFSDVANNTWFSPRFDRRHSANLWLSQSFAANKWSLNMQLLYQSGIAYTAPVATIPGLGLSRNVPVFRNVNNARFPAVHRLDLALDRHWSGKRGNNNTLSAGVYNVYNRINPTDLTFGSVIIPRQDTKFPINQPERRTLGNGVFGLLPYVAFSKSFNY